MRWDLLIFVVAIVQLLKKMLTLFLVLHNGSHILGAKKSQLWTEDADIHKFLDGSKEL